MLLLLNQIKPAKGKLSPVDTKGFSSGLWKANPELCWHAKIRPITTKGLIGLRIATEWLACYVQVRCGQARRVREVLDWFAYAYIQTWFRHCLAACTSNAKVNFCVCTFFHAHSHALALAPSEPGSRETVDSLVPPEPGWEQPFACAQPGRRSGAGNQTRKVCIHRAWLSCMQPTNQALEWASSVILQRSRHLVVYLQFSTLACPFLEAQLYKPCISMGHEALSNRDPLVEALIIGTFFIW